MINIAIYTIAKNEEQFVERWYNSAKDADQLFILDTGSTDNTVKIAKDLGVNVEIQSFDLWRFDVARNSALEMIPENFDMCIALDMDEVLVDGWREQLEKSVSDGVTRARYKYTWSWNEDGSPSLVYGGDKIHSRKNYYWKHPVHEVLMCSGQEIQGWYDIEIHHYQDKLSGTEWGRDRLYIENGFPTIFKTFISNIRINKIQDRVYPVTIDSKQAFIMLKESGIKPDICYIDAAHDYESVMSDLKWAKKIGSKVICGDDYYYFQNGNQIKRAVDEFCLYNNFRAVTKDDQFIIIDNLGKDMYSTLIQRGWHDC